MHDPELLTQERKAAANIIRWAAHGPPWGWGRHPLGSGLQSSWSTSPSSPAPGGPSCPPPCPQLGATGPPDVLA